MYLNYINSFRGIAIIYIVAGHCIDTFNWKNALQLEKLLRILLSNGTVFFVFIAGYLFQHMINKFQIKNYFLKKIKYVWLPYITVSLPAIIYFFFDKGSLSCSILLDKNFYLKIIYFYLTGSHLPQMWFIPMISCFYLLAPLLIFLDKRKWIYLFLPVTVIMSCIYDRETVSGGYFLFLHFFSVYLLGMFFSHYKMTINVFFVRKKHLVYLFSIFILLLTTDYYLINNGTMSFINFLRKLILCAIFTSVLANLKNRPKSQLLMVLAQTSFGIFFIHPYFILGLGKLYGGTQGNLLFFSAQVIFVLLLSGVTVLIIKKILGNYSRFVIGS